MTSRRNSTTGQFEKTWTPEKDWMLRELYGRVPDTELADRLNTSVDVLQHRAPKVGLRKYRARRPSLSLKQLREADQALKAGESLRSIAKRMDSSHTVLRRALKLWKSTHKHERAKARALELAREVPPLTTFRISDIVKEELGFTGVRTFPTPKRIRMWLEEAGLAGVSRVGRSSSPVKLVPPVEA